MRWGLGILAAGAFLAAAPQAGAATQVGETFPAPTACEGFTHIQTGSPGDTYAVPHDGILTAWSAQAGASPMQLRLKVARPAGGNAFEIVGESAIETIAAGTTPSFPVRVPVRAGDRLGLRHVSGPCGAATSGYSQAFFMGDPAVGTTVNFTPSSDFRLDIAATLEPDCDGDGLGDESQDGDISSCAADLAAPNATITDGPKKKTRKKKATFRFSGTDARVLAGFQCSLDGGAFTSCSSPHKVKVKRGKHTFSVRAVDQAANVDGSPATYKWKVKKKRKKK